MLYLNRLTFPFLFLLLWIATQILSSFSSARRSKQARDKAHRDTERMKRLQAEAGRYLEQWKVARKEGDPESEKRYARLAAERLEEVGNRFHSLSMYSVLYATEGNYLKAAATLEEAIQCLPLDKSGDRRGRYLLSKANYLLACGWYTSAHEETIAGLEAIENHIKEEKDSSSSTRSLLVNALQQAALSSAHQYRFEDAHRYIARLQEENQSESELNKTRMTSGIILHYEERLTEALAIYETAMEGESISALLFEAAASVLSDMGRWEEAIHKYNEALARSSGNNTTQLKATARYRISLAGILIEQGNYTEAESLLALAMPVFPSPNRTYKRCCALLLLIKARSKTEPAEVLQEQAKAILAEMDQEIETFLHRRDALRYYLKGFAVTAITLYETGDAAGCLSLIERLTDNDLQISHQSTWYYWRGRCLEDMGDKEAARTAYAIAAACDTEERHGTLAREKLIALNTTV